MVTTFESAQEQLRTAHPLTRFRELYGAMMVEDPAPADEAWLRFAAGMVLVNAHDPEQLAQDLAEAGTRIVQRVRWFEPLASPIRHLVAAVAVQSGLDVDSLVDRLEVRRRAFAKAGLGRGAPAVVAALVHEVAGDAGSDPVGRLGEIAAALRRRHWWLSGRRQLPGCALLATLPLPAEEAVQRCDDCYEHLRHAGLLAGKHLLVAAEILPLADVPPAAACARHLELTAALVRRQLPLWQGAYDALATLALLDHDPDLVIQRFSATLEELTRIDIVNPGSAGYAIAAELTFIDLVRYGRDDAPLGVTADGGELLLERIHRHRAAALVLAYAAMASSDISAGSLPHYPLP
ncbi:MAG: DUF4003 family protein [Planctomycetes bacterium]|nr:DUF4003 family protein [Planctomycetota bacterium]